jgi:hypothetical protein
MGFFKKLTGGADTALLQNGLPARGVILAVNPTGTTLQMGNGLVQRTCLFRVQVTLDNTPPYEAEVKQRIPEVYLPKFVPGATVVAVRVNPANPAEVVLDLEHEAPTVTLARDTSRQSAAEVLATGKQARVVIVQSQPLGMKNADGVDLYGFLLTVLPDDAVPYQTKVGNPTPPEALPLLYPGSNVPAKIGYNDPNDVVIDWKSALQPPTPAQ